MSMRDKSLFPILLGLNGILAIAFVVFLILSSLRHPQFSQTAFPSQEAGATNSPASQLHGTDSATSVVGKSASTNAPQDQASTPPPQPAPEPVFTRRQFGWREVITDDYKTYLESLKAVGCPEDKVRYIVLADIDDYISKKRVEAAIQNDPQWWRAGAEPSVAGLLRDKGLELEEERRQLIARWLGEEAEAPPARDSSYWNAVQLTGPVLGALPADKHETVQEICAESMDRYQTIFWSAINAQQPLNPMDLANLREHTRSELVKTLEPDAVEEFLLRYSHNAERLRQELRGLDVSADEFRQIFRRIDPIDHAMQLEYGSVEAMSPQQRERYETRREQAIREVFSSARLEAYLLTKDPLYRQAQMMALQYGAPSSAILPIYEVTKTNESQRKQIMEDGSLSAEQKRQAINASMQAQQQVVRRIATEAAQQRIGNP